MALLLDGGKGQDGMVEWPAPGPWHQLGLGLNLCSATSRPATLHSPWAAFASETGWNEDKGDNILP